ncbi:MAG: PAS domain-containing protein [Bacteroidota bacterium]|nr:PAS domain-containing protein [Bacteroidota bacterium]
MNTRSGTTTTLNHLIYLPAYAAYLLSERLEEYIQKQMEFSFELEIPLLKFFLQLTEEQRYDISKTTVTEFLTYLADNKAVEQIEVSLKQWKTNQLPIVDRDAIGAEDITLVNYMRKKSLLHFVPGYTTDPYEIIELANEIDLFIIQSITASTNLFIDLFKQRLEEHSHFIQKVNETIPGAVYVFDLDQYKGVYSNQKLPDVIGYDHADLNKLGAAAIGSLVHIEDQESLKQNQILLKQAKDGEIFVSKYRIKKNDSGYKWLANYESVFKRKEDGSVAQTIGITLDIDKEQKALQELHKREQQLSEAQDIAQLGNYYWDFENKRSSVSPKAKELLEIGPGVFENFLQKVHRDDRIKVEQEIEKAMVSGNYSCEYRIQGKTGIKVIWARGVVDYKNGKPAGMAGTVMDVTEQNQLLLQLARADERHKQAEALTHLGTYSWNFVTDDIEWSDEMYRIYEVGKDQNLSYDFILDVVHADDKQMLDRTIKDCIATKKSYDFYYRIITKNGHEKILHSRGQVETNEEGRPEKIVGTDQDVTEKQTLIRKLRKSQSLYKQAEEIAAMGNWTWDVQNNKLEWTDQLYLIYGLPPQSEEINIERFLAFIHPDDREFVARGVDKLSTEKSLDYTFRIITVDGKEKWLRSIAQVLHNENGEVSFIIGTEQDVTEKQKLIEQLQQSEKLYKLAQSLTRMGNWTWDLVTNTTTWSDELFKIYELPNGDPLSQEEWIHYMPPSESNRLLQIFEECLREKKPMDVVHQITLPDGKTKTLHRKGELVFDENGEPIKMIGTTQDVTEQHRTQAELKESQTFIRKITDATPSIIASYNINNGKYTFISEGLSKLLGYDTEEVMQTGTAFFAAIVHPDDLEPMLQKNEKALEEANANQSKNDMVVEFTYRMKHKNGEYRWFHTYGTIFDRNEEGKVEHILNISLDITEQREAIETIKDQEHFIQQVADASPTILYLFDVASQSMAYINREAFFVLGYLPEELINEGANITTLLYHPEDIELLPSRTQSKKVFQQVDSMIQYECRMKHKDGEYRWLLVREIVFKTAEDGSIKQIIGAALDINRRKEMEKTILQNTLQLEQSNASLEEFAYVASHDLKEPLRKISTFGDRLVASQADRLTEEGQLYLHKIIDASYRMQNMISDLLSISMIRGNHSFEPFSLQKILDETLQTLEFKIEQQQAIIRYDGLPEANIIPSQFRQLFQNLISNSLKFVRENIQPLIDIKCTNATEEEVSAFQMVRAASYLKISFSDNGIGFENEYAQKIFAIFQRLHGRSEYEGSGIGLAICKKIVEHHGGVIFANSQAGHGATFTIILPA